jgi:PhnB protein
MANPVQVVTPHLVVNDGNAAIEFYKKALGASEVIRMPAQDGKRLMHSEINVGGARIFVMDDFPEHRGSHGVDAVFPPDQIKGTSVTMHLEVENCDAAVKRARDAGATVTLEPWDSFWGARFTHHGPVRPFLELCPSAAGEGVSEPLIPALGIDDILQRTAGLKALDLAGDVF